MIKIVKSLLAGAVGSVLLTATPFALSENGVSATEVKIGMANALSGPAKALGTGIKRGSEVYFNKVNAAGGVHGRKIKLLSEDDGYEPARSATVTEKLINQDSVFALFGYVGTPTAKASEAIASKSGVPFFGPFTGAEFLRTPVNKLVFNVRGSYSAETELQVERLVKDLGVKKVGLFIQDDAYGVAGKEGAIRALQKRGMAPVAEGRYKRNTEDVDAGLALLKAENPDAVIMVGAYKACAVFVKKAKAAGFHPKFLNLSFVGTADFIKEAGAEGEGVYITQVVPSPSDVSVSVVKQYQADLKAAGIHEHDYTSLEGYIDAVVFVEGLKAAGADLTRDSLLNALNKMKVDVGGLSVSFSQADHQGVKQVYLTKVQGGKAVPVSKL